MGIKKRDIFKAVTIGVDVGKLFVPGAAGKVLDVVSKSIADKNDPTNAEGLKAVAEVNDQQTEAILALHERVRKLEGK
jgi:hypothetical protein